MKFKELTKVVGKKVCKAKARTGLKLKKYSPEIFLALGIVSFGGTVVMACKATLSADDILEHHKKKMKDINDAMKIAEEEPELYEYDEVAYKRDKAVQAFKTGVEFAKAYAPAIALGITSIGCILTSRNILYKRYLVMVTAYESTRTAFNAYRKRVIETEGEVYDQYYMYGGKLETKDSKATLEDGTEIDVKEAVSVDNSDITIPEDDTARWMKEGNPHWDKRNNYVLMTMRALETRCTDTLRARGHIFLNEVYDLLGFDHTPIGAMVGWCLNDPESDDFVDFGLYSKGAADYVNGSVHEVLLTFNHSGVIINKI